MDSIEYDQSRKSGPHSFLRALVGQWEGHTRTWFDPEILADEFISKGSSRPIFEGRFVLFEYQSGVLGEPLEGSMIIGCNLQTNRFEVAWVDTFHMGTGIMFSTGVVSSQAIAVLGAYPDPTGGPDWGWRTDFIIPGRDQLTIIAYNITPGGQEFKAIETTYRRVG